MREGVAAQAFVSRQTGNMPRREGGERERKRESETQIEIEREREGEG